MSVSCGALGWRLAWKWCTLMVQTNLILGGSIAMPSCPLSYLSPHLHRPAFPAPTSRALSIVIKRAFTWQTSGLVYGISCRRCPAICIGETGRTPRQCLDEHRRSIKKNLPGFPIAEHFNAAGHSIDDVLVLVFALRCDLQRKRLEMCLISNSAPFIRAAWIPTSFSFGPRRTVLFRF